jgi:hypothetical protein
MTIVQTDIPDNTDGVRVDSICRTRRSRRASWIAPENVASIISFDDSPRRGKLTVD